MSRQWIQTLENRKLTPLDLLVDQVGSIEEIAHALAGKFRFTCQTRERYSVAEHCVRGSLLLPPIFAGAFLLHELSEVYLPDIAGPIKSYVCVDAGPVDGVTTWMELERHHTKTILTALELASIEPLIYCREIQEMDRAMLAAEKRDLCGPEPESWGIGDPAKTQIDRVWSPDAASSAFLARYYELFFGNRHG